jgi:hypothetical protein
VLVIALASSALKLLGLSNAALPGAIALISALVLGLAVPDFRRALVLRARQRALVKTASTSP